MSTLPSKLKKQNLFINGYGFGGEAKTVNLPKLKQMTEGYRGGSMIGKAKYRTGELDELKLEFTLGGLAVVALREFGNPLIDGTQLRFAGGYERVDTGEVSAVEVIVHGQINEIDMGDSEPGKDTEHKYVVDCVYYKLIVDGADEIELDFISGIEKYQGVEVAQGEALRIAAGG